MKTLKDFINRNRESFDNRQPSENVWKAIESKIPKPLLWNNLALWRVAAVIMFGITSWLLITNKPSETVNQKAITQLQGEFYKLEEFYAEEIAEKVEWISDGRDTLADDRFAQDFKKLDAMYQVLREQMKTNPTKQVKDALVLNMLVRIDLLNQQIQKLEESKREERTNRSTEI